MMSSSPISRRRLVQAAFIVFVLFCLLMLINLYYQPVKVQGSNGDGNQAFLPAVFRISGQTQPPDVGGPVVPYVFEGDVRSLPTVQAWQPGDAIVEVPLGVNPAQNESLTATDTRETDATSAVTNQPNIGADTPAEFLNANPNFDGIPFTGFAPPDTQGDVGPDHYIQVVNVSFQIFDKQGNSLAGPTAINQLWASEGFPGPCSNLNQGDPIVAYDHLADRWLISQFANPNGFATPPTHECIAVSRTGDPVSGGWYLYDFTFNFGHDYPKIGVWPDAYYMSSQTGYSGGNLNAVAFDRANMLMGNPATFQAFSLAGPALVILPSDLDGPAPPAGTPNIFARHVDGGLWGGADRVELYAFQVNWGNPLMSSFTGPTTLLTTPFDSGLCNPASLFENCIPQPGTTQRLEAMTVWPMYRLQYRNFGTHESLVFNHTVDADGNDNAGIRWYELRRNAGVWSIFQQSTFAPQNFAVRPAWEHRWMGSVAMDKVGNIALGYSVASTNTTTISDINGFPSIRYAGRLATDPLGQLPHGEATLVNGTGPQILFNNLGNPITRWGDYSSMSVDPVDDCTFWYTQEYAVVNNTWRTRIGAFRFPICNPADLSISKSSSPDPVVAGEELTYEIEVTNLGPDTATNVVVTDTLPPGVTYVSDTDSCVEGPTGTLVCTLGELMASDTETFTIVVSVDSDLVAESDGTAVITNQAEVSGYELDLDLTNNETEVDTTVIDEADLQVTKECQPTEPIIEGEEAVCTMTIENLGPSTARQVTAVDTHTSESKFDFGLIDPPTCTTTPNPQDYVGEVSCSLGNLAAGESIIIAVPLTPLERFHDIFDTVVVASDTSDPNEANNEADAVVEVTTLADLELTKTASPNPVRAGQTLRYDLTIRNLGPQKALDIVLEDWLPAGVSIDSITILGLDGSCTAGVPGDMTQPTVCTFDELEDGRSVRVRIIVTVAPEATGTLINEAAVRSEARDEDLTNNEAMTETEIWP